jgi:membrane-anchored protein YejM (alkaline phosphatase superfamily)
MIFQRPTYAERRARMINWHPWFAWFPVRSDDGGSIYWLEWIERRADEIYSYRQGSK